MAGETKLRLHIGIPAKKEFTFESIKDIIDVLLVKAVGEKTIRFRFVDNDGLFVGPLDYHNITGNLMRLYSINRTNFNIIRNKDGFVTFVEVTANKQEEDIEKIVASLIKETAGVIQDGGYT